MSCLSRVEAVMMMSRKGVLTMIEPECSPGGKGFESITCRTPVMNTGPRSAQLAGWNGLTALGRRLVGTLRARVG